MVAEEKSVAERLSAERDAAEREARQNETKVLQITIAYLNENINSIDLLTDTLLVRLNAVFHFSHIVS
jgi:hypothetical protein